MWFQAPPASVRSVGARLGQTSAVRHEAARHGRGDAAPGRHAGAAGRAGVGAAGDTAQPGGRAEGGECAGLGAAGGGGGSAGGGGRAGYRAPAVQGCPQDGRGLVAQSSVPGMSQLSLLSFYCLKRTSSIL